MVENPLPHLVRCGQGAREQHVGSLPGPGTVARSYLYTRLSLAFYGQTPDGKLIVDRLSRSLESHGPTPASVSTAVAAAQALCGVPPPPANALLSVLSALMFRPNPGTTFPLTYACAKYVASL